MSKRTDSDLDQYLALLESEVPDSFANAVMKKIQADEVKRTLHAVPNTSTANDKAKWPKVRTILEAGLLLLGGALGFSQVIAFIFGIWTVTTVG